MGTHAASSQPGVWVLGFLRVVASSNFPLFLILVGREALLVHILNIAFSVKNMKNWSEA